MPAHFVLKVYCIPPDIEAEKPSVNEDFLQACVADIQKSANRALGHVIRIGIAIVRDGSDYLVGDTIWAEGEFRGSSTVRAIEWTELNKLSTALMRAIHGYVISHVNHPERLAVDGRVPCEFISVTVGAENAPVTATNSRTVD